MALVSFEDAKTHLRITGEDHDADIQTKLDQASAMVINYLKRPDHTWEVDTDPNDDPEFGVVQASILNVLAKLFQHRGDGDEPIDPLADVRAVLSMLRDPSLA